MSSGVSPGILDEVGRWIHTALPIAHNALIDVLVNTGKHEAGLAFSAPPVRPHFRQRVNRPVAAFRAEDRRPERSREFGERIARPQPPYWRWHDVGGVVADESGTTRTFKEPFERFLCQRITLISPANVRVSPNEPTLLNSIRPGRGERFSWIAWPTEISRSIVTLEPVEFIRPVRAYVCDEGRVSEITSMLVYRKGVPRLLDECRRTHVVMKSKSALYTGDRQGVPSDCAHGVVHAEVRDLNTARPSNE
jgi:hypothetical protein